MIGLFGPRNGQTGGFWLGHGIFSHISIYPFMTIGGYMIIVKGRSVSPRLIQRSRRESGPEAGHCGLQPLQPNDYVSSKISQVVKITEDRVTDLRYPIGKFTYEGPITEDQKRSSLDDIAHTPAKLRAA